PATSNLNISAWPQTIANHAIVPVSTRGVAVYTFAGAHIIADVEGWYLGTPATATLNKPANPSPAEVDAAWILAPQMNVSLPVAIGPDPQIIANSGTAASWTWKASVSGTAHSMIFGHRTSHGGPFRYINSFAVGDVFFVRNVVGEWFRYRVMHVAVVRPKFSLLEAISAFLPTGTMQLIACSQANGTPGGVAYRFVVTARMIGVGQTPG
ncbi:MAG: sortase, partial [Actinomycetota bacterium]